LSNFLVFEHILKNTLIPNGSCLTIVKGLVKTLDSVTGNINNNQDSDSLYELIKHSMKSNYITEPESNSIVNDIVLLLENNKTK